MKSAAIRTVALTLLTVAIGCSSSDNRSFDVSAMSVDIKPGMTREEVLAKYDYPDSLSKFGSEGQDGSISYSEGVDVLMIHIKDGKVDYVTLIEPMKQERSPVYREGGIPTTDCIVII